jgi:hypothetical protein
MPLTLLQRPLVLIFADDPATIASLEAKLNTTQQGEVDELIEHSPYGYEEPIYSQFHGYRGTRAERLKALRNALIAATMQSWDEDDDAEDEENTSNA